MRNITAAALQLSFTDDEKDDIAATAEMAVSAARDGADIVLPPELYQGHYFCRYEREELFERARPTSEHPAISEMQKVAKAEGIYLPASFFERDGPHHYNSLAMIDPDGEIMGVYRKSHIPDGPGYEEKFYFRPGNTGFMTWQTRFGTVGVGICWDQWFPEAARAMVLQGAELLLYPTAIGSEPEEPDLDTATMWKRAMVGHAVSNTCPVVAANRTGTEDGQTFYGSSFAVDEYGETKSELGRDETGYLLAAFDLDLARAHRASFGFFRDRRPDLYARLGEDV
ncbi:N-carbamoylputrescine amidase [Pacificimonas flava]|uniref:N-carbamoylputrescine amidase n=2 Tax=Pacificimonas TaxID=1960290 RepID=A0A219B7B6_9SPHN|nr:MULTISPECIES: nitrilase-related carbon-nitrogen hydrolase [Pacificimonas]MBZ6379075.1 N-carbamoylputrescine amidase [Pacificimonas aurantium]OWV33689.1 N-carbamoylputrescine amidase [Pacificimonas flava]